MSYVSLHTHSEWSLLDGLGTSEQIAQRAAELGHPALAITDHGTLSGALYHIQACEKVGIKPIVGSEFYFRHDILADRTARNNRSYFHLVLLAKNNEGFKNLMRLSSISYTERNFYQKPCIDWQLLRKHSEGLLCSSSCLSGVLPSEVVRSDPDAIMKYLRVFRDIFGDDFYLEIQPHDIDEQRIVNLHLANLAQQEGLPLVVAGDVHYPFKEWAPTQDILVMISTGQSKTKREKEELEGKGYMKFSGDSFYLMSEEELLAEFRKHHPSLPEEVVVQSISSTLDIADRCDHISVSKKPKVPKATRSVLETERILRSWIEEGLQRIGKEKDETYLARVEEELAVMKKLNILDYYIVVGDMVRWAKKYEGIRVGAARGSAGGSLVNYLIGITALDPIGYGLLFERFLNEYRTELPDIDIDFQDDRRDEVRDYLVERWGSDHVVSVASFQTFGLKAVINDVSRVLDIPLQRVRRVTKAIPDKTWGETLESLEETVPQLKEFFEEYPEVKEHATRLQGQAKNQSKHAAAVIVTDKPAQDLIPMMQSKDGSMVTQWTERANGQLISPYGFLKIDMLSTDSLTIQQKCIDTICRRHPHRFKYPINFEDLKEFPVNESPDNADQKVIDAFNTGQNLGIFQMSSNIMRGLLKEIKPDKMHHIIAANALIRPGTARREYALRKNGKKWKLPSQSLAPFLEETYGIPTYQEQIISIVRTLGKDIEPPDAAALLKIVSKGVSRDLETRNKLKKYEQQFKEGCSEKGIDSKEANLIWKQITDASAEYLFNKSHATGYALQAYQDMWLKINYPLEFYAALLSIETTKIPQIIKEMRQNGIQILPPDINKSDWDFDIDGDSIRMGLVAIKGLGDATIMQLLSYRPFASWEDMLAKMPTNKLTKARKESLFGAGALDCWGARTQWILDPETSDRIKGTLSEEERVSLEVELLGLPISKTSDIDTYTELLEQKAIATSVLEEMENQEVVVGGEITGIKEHKTKYGETMAFVRLEFGDNEYSLTLWPNKYQQYSPREGTVVLAKGDWDKFRQAVVVKDMIRAEELANEFDG